MPLFNKPKVLKSSPLSPINSTVLYSSYSIKTSPLFFFLRLLGFIFLTCIKSLSRHSFTQPFTLKPPFLTTKFSFCKTFKTARVPPFLINPSSYSPGFNWLTIIRLSNSNCVSLKFFSSSSFSPLPLYFGVLILGKTTFGLFILTFLDDFAFCLFLSALAFSNLFLLFSLFCSANSAFLAAFSAFFRILAASLSAKTSACLLNLSSLSIFFNFDSGNLIPLSFIALIRITFCTYN